jgi:hypothetical protein
VETKDELYDAIINLNQSLVLVGPIQSFEIHYENNHPRIIVPVKNNCTIAIPCTDPKFCEYVIANIDEFEEGPFYHYASSSELTKLQDKKVYLVIGLTGDHLDENGDVATGKYAPSGTNIKPRYWPMVVSVLVVCDDR